MTRRTEEQFVGHNNANRRIGRGVFDGDCVLPSDTTLVANKDEVKLRTCSNTSCAVAWKLSSGTSVQYVSSVWDGGECWVKVRSHAFHRGLWSLRRNFDVRR